MRDRNSNGPGRHQVDIWELTKTCFRPVTELWLGLASGALPFQKCFLAGFLALTLIPSKLDRWLWFKMHILRWYPASGVPRAIYVLGLASTGFVVWSIYRAGIFHRLKVKLDYSFATSGLQNRLGRRPKFLGDWPVDTVTRKFRVTNASLPKDDFVKAKDAVEASLRVYIDDIREHRTYGTIDVLYSKTPMPTYLDWYECQVRGHYFAVGQTRSQVLDSSLLETPHLLVAGQTGGGKSTFLRQLITSLYLSDQKYHFSLADLKGGLEFQIFESLPRVTVMADITQTLAELSKVEAILKSRMAKLKELKLKDVEGLSKLKESERGKLPEGVDFFSRHVVVVDEASEMFLAGHHASPKDIQKARAVLSQIARQGRAVGVHIVIATQRPDSRALDPQVKANLTGVLCFQMANDASSMVVLGCGRATDLPPIPGRAIWKAGSEMTEVQTPQMTLEEAETLLAPYRDKDSKFEPTTAKVTKVKL